MSAGEAIGVTTGSILAGLPIDHVKLNTLLNAQAAIYVSAGLLAFILLKPASEPTPKAPPAPLVPPAQ